jgi:hypothetical protein
MYVYGRIPLKWISKKYVRVWTGFRIGTSGGLVKMVMKLLVPQNAENFLSG